MHKIQRKVFKQDLSGSKDDAALKAVYTWKKDEIAWIVGASGDIFKVQFTGEVWLSGNKWSYDKIYQYRFVHVLYIGDENSISHSKENELFVSFLDAYTFTTNKLKHEKEDVMKKIDEKLKILENYKEKMIIEVVKDIKTFYEL